MAILIPIKKNMVSSYEEFCEEFGIEYNGEDELCGDEDWREYLNKLMTARLINLDGDFSIDYTEGGDFDYFTIYQFAPRNN